MVEVTGSSPASPTSFSLVITLLIFMLNWILDDIIALRETDEVEFKKASGIDGKGSLPKEFWPTYSAFANTNGGDIFLGIEESQLQNYCLKIAIFSILAEFLAERAVLRYSSVCRVSYFS